MRPTVSWVLDERDDKSSGMLSSFASRESRRRERFLIVAVYGSQETGKRAHAA